MRKIILLMVTVIAVLFLFGCSSNQDQTASTDEISYDDFVQSPPVKVSLVGEAEISIEAGKTYLEQGAVSEDDSEIAIMGDVNTSKAGEYTVYYTSAAPGAIQIERKVKVVDNTPPVITLKGNKDTFVSAESYYKEPGAKVYDLGDPNVKVTNSRSETENGAFTVTYTATDFSGNTATLTRTVTIKDIVQPTINLSGSKDVYVLRDTSYAEAGFTASDDLDGDVTAAVTINGSVNTAVCGAYAITYSVSDKSGNVGTATRVIHVYSQQTDCPDRVYLTFDDGPSSSVTPQVLDILKRNGVKATFFIIDYPDSRKALIKRIVDEGHTLAIHTANHDYKVCYASDEAYLNGIQYLHDKILADTGYDARIIRFPGGTSNGVSRSYCSGIMSRLAVKTVELGYSYFDWNVDSGDASGNGVSASKIYSNVTSGLRRGRNNVVLMHDTGAKATTAAALDDMINYCKANGYAILPITTDTLPVRHKATN